jgi:hypothetical protein
VIQVTFLRVPRARLASLEAGQQARKADADDPTLIDRIELVSLSKNPHEKIQSSG